MTEIHSFAPVIDNNSKVLILGSMPGKKSLEMRQYYAHPQNNFWKFIYALFETKTDQKYEGKIEFLKSKRIALWDVIASCERSSSLDSEIINPVINDFPSLLKNYPGIKVIIFNGRKAEQFFKKYSKGKLDKNIRLIDLPSTSPANAGISRNDKLEQWSVIKSILI